MSEKEILDLEDKRFGAMIKGDFKALDAIVHDELSTRIPPATPIPSRAGSSR